MTSLPPRIARNRNRALTALICSWLVWLCSCAVGPDYRKPDVTLFTSGDWRWKIGEPKDAAPKGEWWKVFNDATLDDLEARAMANNQNLRGAVARVDAARAGARLTRSQFFPDISFDPVVNRQRTSGHLPTPIPFKVPSAHFNTFSMPIDLSYEVDLWGRVRRSFESARAQAQASVADYQNVLLTLTADVAVDYFLLRSLDAEIGTLQGAIDLRNESLRILHARFVNGTTPEIDEARAKVEVATAKEDLADTMRQRAETLDALALLCGQSPNSFQIAERSMADTPPIVPVGLPSSVLERRPDIASAERKLAAKNAEIGVARAAYFPALRLVGQAGYLSAEASSLFAGDSRVWSIGPAVSLPLFNAGRTAAENKQAVAAYREALADYRETILAALKEVEDSLAQIVFWNQQALAQEEALAAARRVVELARVRYDAGKTSYLEVVDAERDRLQQDRQKALLQSQRFSASTRLIKALGGRWDGN